MKPSLSFTSILLLLLLFLFTCSSSFFSAVAFAQQQTTTSNIATTINAAGGGATATTSSPTDNNSTNNSSSQTAASSKPRLPDFDYAGYFIDDTAEFSTALRGLCRWTTSDSLCMGTVVPILFTTVCLLVALVYNCVITPQKDALLDPGKVRDSPLWPSSLKSLDDEETNEVVHSCAGLALKDLFPLLGLESLVTRAAALGLATLKDLMSANALAVRDIGIEVRECRIMARCLERIATYAKKVVAEKQKKRKERGATSRGRSESGVAGTRSQRAFGLLFGNNDGGGKGGNSNAGKNASGADWKEEPLLQRAGGEASLGGGLSSSIFGRAGGGAASSASAGGGRNRGQSIFTLNENSTGDDGGGGGGDGQQQGDSASRRRGMSVRFSDQQQQQNQQQGEQNQNFRSAQSVSRFDRSSPNNNDDNNRRPSAEPDGGILNETQSAADNNDHQQAAAAPPEAANARWGRLRARFQAMAALNAMEQLADGGGDNGNTVDLMEEI